MADREFLLNRARAMRREPTFAEARLWKLLRDRRLAGLKFRRQVPIGTYIADFLCLDPRLVVEADGPRHQDPDYDARRDAWFRAERFTVLRFSNTEIVATPGSVIQAVLNASGRA